MAYDFKPAVRESVGLLIGLIGQSGSGKTFSAMRLAAGLAGEGNRFAVIDTEARRALHYAEMFQFDHCELNPPFRPDTYAEAIQAADKAGYGAIVVDSVSHEWNGEGGVLDWQESELIRMAGDDYKRREIMKMASWIKPKMGHKQMVQRMLQIKAHLILCFRAEEKIKMEKDANGKMQIVPIGWQPVCSKELPYELTVSFLLDADHPGIPKPLKLQEQHKKLFPLDKLLNEDSGKLIASWAKGGVPKEATQPASQQPQDQQTAPATGDGKTQERKSRDRLEILINEAKINRDRFKEWLLFIGWLPVPENEGRLSMNDVSDKNVKYMVSKWDSAKTVYEKWVAEQSA